MSAFVVDVGDDVSMSLDDGQLGIVRAFHLGAVTLTSPSMT